MSEQKRSYIDPQSINIDGEINGIFFTGTIEASFENTDSQIDKFNVIFGNELNEQIGFHNIKVLIDGNTYLIKTQQLKEAKSTFEKGETQGEQVIFGQGDESYSTFYISNVLQNQVVSFSIDFELPINFIEGNNIDLSFPLIYAGSGGRQALKCKNFKFSVKSSFFELKEKSISSSPEGQFDASTSTYIIDHLKSSVGNIRMIIDPNFTENFFNDDLNFFSADNQVSTENNIGIFSGKYGSIKFVPSKDREKIEDHSGEEFIFVVDSSGSMSGDPIKLAAQCLIIFIKSLPKDCYFNVIQFGTNYVPLFGRPVKYTNENADKALNLAKKLCSDLHNTNLYQPLKYIFSHPLTENDKLRRVFVLTDGEVNDKSEVISLVDNNSKTTMCSAIGIGNCVDRNLVEKIGEKGNGFVDFVSSCNDDMKSTVINQLSKSLNGFCNVEISIENNESFEIVPPLSSIKFQPGFPSTLYFKTNNIIDENTHVLIDVEGNESILSLKSLPENSKTQKSLEFMFNNENIKCLRKQQLTEEIKSKIIQISVEHGILSPYVGLIGVRQFESPEKEEEIINKIQNLRNQLIDDKKYFTGLSGFRPMCVKTVAGKNIPLSFDSNDYVGDLKLSIYEKEGIPVDHIYLVYKGRQLEDDKKLSDYSMQDNSTVHIVLRLRSDSGCGSGLIEYKLDEIRKQPIIRDNIFKVFDKEKAEDLVSIISKQKIEGYWMKIPNEIEKDKYDKMKAIIEKASDLYKQMKIKEDENKIIGTICCLIFMKKFMLNDSKTWTLVYNKGMEWLFSVEPKVNWNNVLKYLL